MRYIEDRIIEVDFPISEFAYQYKEQLINQFKSDFPVFPYRIGNEPMGFNVECRIESLNNYLYGKFYRIIHDIFDVCEPDRLGNYLFIQNGENYASSLHQHIWAGDHNGICETSYLNLPDEGGEFKYYLGKGIQKHKVQEDKLYIFPNHLYHAPVGSDDLKYRICFNLEYLYNNPTKVYDKNKGWYW